MISEWKDSTHMGKKEQVHWKFVDGDNPQDAKGGKKEKQPSQLRIVSRTQLGVPRLNFWTLPNRSLVC